MRKKLSSQNHFFLGFTKRGYSESHEDSSNQLLILTHVREGKGSSYLKTYLCFERQKRQYLL